MKKVSMMLEYGVNMAWDKMDKWQKEANQYTCTLKYNGKQYTVPFFQGIGISHEPTWKEVLGCLISDANSFHNTRSFEDWCNELGYDEDSRKAEKIYKQCENIARRLETLLGTDYEEIAATLQEEGY